MLGKIAFIGFGEAGQCFAAAMQGGAGVAAFDILFADSAKLSEVRERFTAIETCDTLNAAMAGATIVISVVTADEALSAAQGAAGHLARGTLYCDMNSVAPDTKRAAAHVIEAAGGHYVDVAVMAPVYPAKLEVPLLLSGPHGESAAAALKALGFGNVRALTGEVGRASSIKMIRSIMVKGVEALTAEMILAARAADVADEVLASLGEDWPAKAAYNLERMTTHGRRRAAEMGEVATTLQSLGIEPIMTRGTIIRQTEMAA